MSYRQVDHWCTVGVLVPADEVALAGGSSSANPGSGAARGFSPDELRVACALAALRDLGMPLHLLARVGSQLRLAPERVWSEVAYVSPDGWLSSEPPAAAWVLDLSTVPDDLVAA